MQENSNIYIFRESIGRLGYQPFDSIKANQVINKIITPKQTKEIGLIRRKSPEAYKRLNEVIIRLGITKTDIEPAALSAYYATDAAVDNFQSIAIGAQQNRDPALFILFFDTDFGASMGASPILEVARPELVRTPPGQDIATILSNSVVLRERLFGTNVSLSRQVELIVGLQAEKHRWALLFDETTNKNPKGFILMNERTKQLKNLPNRLSPSNSPDYFVSQFVAAGADFTRILFRTIYPVAEQFIASK